MINTFFKTIKSYSIIMIIISLLLGIALVAFPEESIKYISMAAGISIIILGIVAIVDYFSKSHSTFILVLGIIALLSGIVIAVKYKSLITFIEFLFGMFILVSGIVDLVTSFNAAKVKHKSWVFTVIMSVVAIVFGIVCILRPFDVTTTLVRFIGIGLLLYSVLDIVSYFQFKNVEKAVTDAVNSQSEIVDDNARIINDDE